MEIVYHTNVIDNFMGKGENVGNFSHNVSKSNLHMGCVSLWSWGFASKTASCNMVEEYIAQVHDNTSVRKINTSTNNNLILS